jgi:hypothetical protein
MAVHDPHLDRLVDEAQTQLERARRALLAGKALPMLLAFYEADLEPRAVFGLSFGSTADKPAAFDAAGARAGPGIWAVLSLDDVWVSIETLGPEPDGAAAGDPQ